MNFSERIRRKVMATISRYEMVLPGDRLIVAVSGGPDSVCLLDILFVLGSELGTSLVMAHYDHGLRPEEDESETHFVLHLAQSRGIPFETEKAPAFSVESKRHNEEALRNMRYTFLEKVREKYQAQKIALGHHLNDQAETVLMRLLRGSGPAGLGGIPPCRENRYIRPLIEMERMEIEAYLKERGISYVTDSSNLRTDYLRNQVRLALIPALQGYQPQLLRHLGEMAEILREDSAYLEGKAQEWVIAMSEQFSHGSISIPIPPFMALHPSLGSRVMRNLIRRVKGDLRRISRRHLKAILDLAIGKKSQGSLNLPNGLVIRKIYDHLHLSIETRKADMSFCHSLIGPGRYFIQEIPATLLIEEIARPAILRFPDSLLTAHLDAQKLPFPLVVRNYRPGDRFSPLGMKGQKKVKDFFVDQKVPMDLRRRTPMIISNGVAVWICGYRIDDRFKVTPETGKILRLTLDWATV